MCIRDRGTLSLKSGSLYLSGVGTSFTAAGDVVHNGSDLHVDSGASINLPKLTTITVSVFDEAVFTASDANSSINLPSLAQVSLPDFYKLRFQADDGAHISAPAL